MLNSTEHETSHAEIYKNVKIPTNVYIFSNICTDSHNNVGYIWQNIELCRPIKLFQRTFSVI